jgi:dihydroflavonol-4-reductase
MWLVTGATGHIGNVLVRKLIERGEKVRVLILPNECRAPLDGLEVEAFEGDVLNVDSLFGHAGVKGLSRWHHFDHAGRRRTRPPCQLRNEEHLYVQKK